jgi:tetratricopeptide (TPR) repeat protein
MRLGRVFISSVFGGMLDVRRSAAEAAALLGLETVLTEEHVAQPGTVRAALDREIGLCDTYVGLFAQRRGTVPPAGTADHRAITEEELRLAREKGLRCLVFLSRDGAASREPGLAEFLDREVSDYATGVWARPYDTQESLRREIAAALAAVRPRMVLSLQPGPAGLQARLFLGGLQPAWTGEPVLGPAPVDLDLGPGPRGVLDAFRRGPASRELLHDGDLQVAGGAFAAQAFPGPLGEALAQGLGLAGGALIILEIRTEDDRILDLPWELLSLPGHPLPVRAGTIEIVRRLTLPGEADDPVHDPAPSVPAEHLAVLGFTAAPAEDLDRAARLGAGGLGDSDLFWEREQERLLAALDGLLREGRGRLILPDTGDKEELRRELARPGRPHVVHISCHGGLISRPDGSREPALFLEDAGGHRAPLTAPELLSWVRATPGAPPGLLVLSACSTAGMAGDGDGGSGAKAEPLGGGAPLPGEGRAMGEGTGVRSAAGFAESLVRGGLPRVLGMQSTVSDPGATAFAGGLYAALARGTDLAAALRAGRAELAAGGGPHEWAIPTLTVRRDSGPLAAPEGSAPRVAIPFEVTREDFRIAGISYLAQGYVGRRDAERRLRRAFDRGEPLIVIHGLGGIGKSTLAARFLERRRAEGARILVLYAGRVLAPATFLDAVAERAGVSRPAGLPPEQTEKKFREDLQAALQSGSPTILLLDNFEDNQDADGRLLHPDLASAFLDLARLGGPALRLIATSRLALEGPLDVINLDLGELSPSGCRKLRLVDVEKAGLGSLDERTWQAVLLRLGGHPKALELLGGYLRSKPDRALSLLRRLEEGIQAVHGKLSAKEQSRGRSLLVADVLANVPDSLRPSFDRLCLLFESLPTEELEALLAAEGIADPLAAIAWLRDHGLLARAAAPSALTGGDLVHRLLADSRRGALQEREGEEAARSWHLRVAAHLVERPGPLSDLGIAARHRDAAGDRAGALDMYNRWALSLRDRHAYAACVHVAHEGLEAFPIRDNEAERVAAATLWVSIHDGFQTLGKLEGAWQALESASELLQEGVSPEAQFIEAGVSMLKGRLLVAAGRTREGEALLKDSLEGFARGGRQRERALVLGEVARLRAQSGDVAGALKLHEERLGIFESLGDVQSRAVTLGDVARLRAQSGDVAGALKLHEEELRVYESLGDVRLRAVTLGDVARLRAQSGDVAGALKLHEERLGIFESLGDVRSRAVTLGDVARLRAQSGDVAGALKLHEERLGIMRTLGDINEIAAAQFDLASLYLKEGQKEEARARLAESWQINVKIGRADGIAFVGALYGQLLLATDPSQAITILQTAREAFQRLGRTQQAGEIEAFLERLKNQPERSAATP